MWSDPRLRAAALVAVALTLLAAPAAAQCRPASERTGEVGCWIVAREPLGRPPGPTICFETPDGTVRGGAPARPPSCRPATSTP